jgi:1,4-dihydroxy-2-naphthoate polyprenyltransferase
MSGRAVWLLAIRPKTLPAAGAGVVVGSALAWSDGLFSAGPAAAALLIALLLQIGSNLANDVYDTERGADTAERKGPLRVTQAGLLTPRQVKAGMLIVFSSAFALGLYLTFMQGWIVLVIGIAAIIAAIAYTGGPYPLGYHGLGEIFVFIFFGLAAVAGTYFVQTGLTTPLVWLMSIPIGLIITALLVVNNLRDIKEDATAGKRTLAVRIGAAGTRAEYLVCMVVAYALPLALVGTRLLPWPALTALLSLPWAISASRVVITKNGRDLNPALALTSQTALAFGLFFAVGLIAAS